MSPSTSAASHPLMRPLLATAVLICASGAAWFVAAQQQPTGPAMHPAEFAMRAFMAPIEESAVVRDGPASNDVWLFSGASFEAAAERARKAISTRQELPGGVRVAAWTYMEPTRSYWLELEGGTDVRVQMSRHLDGTLFILRGAGRADQAPRWAPPYRPLPIDLPHGPVR